MKFLFYLVLSLVISFTAEAQCVIPSADGYAVNATISPTAVIRPSSCPWGYNYNIEFNYNVFFSEVNIPSTLWTLQVEIECNGQNNGKYGLPLSGGSGSTVTTSNPSISHTGSANQYGSNPHCNDATLQTLQCNRVFLIIQGPGIPYQRILCNTIVGLPVEFLGLYARETKAGNEIRWHTESELRNSHFTLRHSTDGKNWSEMAEVPGNGTTDKISDYTFIHQKPGAGHNYYSLSQTDYDGTTKELGIIGVENLPDEDILKVFPNPASDGNVSLKLSSLKDDKLDFRLTDELGRLIGEGELTENKALGNRNVFEQAIALPAGYRFMYVSIYRNGELVKTEKIISL